jgi:hypothetical protein
LGICQIGVDNFQLAFVRQAANSPHDARASGEVFPGASHGDHRTTAGQQVTHDLSADKTCRSGD